MTKAKREAFLKGITEGKFDNYRAMVYNLISQGHAKTLNAMIDNGIPEKTASGRVSELMDMGLVKVVGEISLTGGNVSVFSAVWTDAERDSLMFQRCSEKKEQWLKKGKEMGWSDEFLLF